eukprot:359078-Chlamydomonas_euryale.AAC.2
MWGAKRACLKHAWSFQSSTARCIDARRSASLPMMRVRCQPVKRPAAMASAAARKDEMVEA